MEKNVGGNDRTARLVLGPVLVIVAAAWYVGFMLPAATTTAAVAGAAVLALLGVVLVVTGATQKCVLNSVLGLNTYRSGEESDTEMGRPGD